MAESFQELQQHRQHEAFVGREVEALAFEENLLLPVTDPRRRFIVAVAGQGGMGKTTFMNHCRRISDAAGVATGWADDSADDLVEVMSSIARELPQAGEFADFEDRVADYRKCRRELEGNAEAPSELPRLIAATAARAGTKVARRVPVVGLAFDFVDDNALGEKLGEYAAFVFQQSKRREDAELVLNPVEILSPLFVDALKALMDKTAVALFFDTFEETRHVVEPWLLSLLGGRYGNFPQNFLLTLAGRVELDPNAWGPYQALVEQIELGPLKDQASREFLARKGITDQASIEEILQLSQGIPILLVSMAIGDPEDPQATDTAVDRVLHSVSPGLRQLAIDGAVPRLLNRDVIGIISSEKEEASFERLLDMPFVESTSDGWRYHPVIRREFSHYAKRDSPERWEAIHRDLAKHYIERARQIFETADFHQLQSYDTEQLYHRLCVSYSKTVKTAVSRCIGAWTTDPGLARPWALAIRQAEEDRDTEPGDGWGTAMVTAIDEFARSHDQVGLEILTRVIDSNILEDENQAKALQARAQIHGNHLRLTVALADLDCALEIAPDLIDVRLDRARMRVVLEDYEVALQDCETALSSESLDVNQENSGTVLYIRVAREILNADDALDLVDAFLEVTPNHRWALITRGEIKREAGSIESAIADLKRACDLASEGRGHRPWEALAETYAGETQVEKAQEAFEEALQLDATCRSCWRGLANVLRNRAKPEDLVSHLSRIADDQQDLGVAVARGLALLDVDLIDAAREELQHAVESDPQMPELRVALCQLFVYEKNWRRGLDEAEAALRLQSDLPEALLLRGHCRSEKGDFEGAEEDWRVAEEQGPREWMVADWSERGLVLSRLGRYEEALAFMDRSLVEEWNAIDAYNRFVALARLEGTEAAAGEIPYLERSLEGTENEIVRVYGRAGMKAVLGEHEDALEGLAHAMEIDGTSAREWAESDHAWLDLRDEQRFRAVLGQARPE